MTPSPRLTVLITHPTLEGRSGSVLYVRDIALGLLRAGHLPIVFTPYLGDVGNELRQATVPVISDLTSLREKPDVVLGNGHSDQVLAWLEFPNAPCIHICHAWDHWLTQPPVHLRDSKMIAVDLACRDWLVCEQGVAPESVKIILNAVDTDRFPQRPNLPSKPQHALVFSSYFHEDNGLNVIRQACVAEGLTMSVAGEASRQLHSTPESILGDYDIVFAKARCAVEAAAVGNAVILANVQGAGPLLSMQNIDFLWQRNLGRRVLDRQLSVDYLREQIRSYDPIEARRVSDYVRLNGNLVSRTQELIDWIQFAIRDHRSHAELPPEVWIDRVKSYLRQTQPMLSRHYQLLLAKEKGNASQIANQRELENLRRGYTNLEAAYEHLRKGYLDLQTEYAYLKQRLEGAKV